MAVQVLVFSCIDYGNALLLGATDRRLIFLVGPATSSTPLLLRLRWLPMREHIEFKILVIIYKSFNSQAPDYLSYLIVFCKLTYATHHHMTAHFFPYQELAHVLQIMRFKSLVHVCGILSQPTWDNPNHWTFLRGK